ncbi:glycosyltransferase [Metallosphaera hakonensis]|uniref:glycosyltransferase n=1 Tax=Metallosphaera hakonensis TaxID=79601 RepID=UPI0006D1F699|nr:glycosyltransferase [Metallosphaera hakonensis]
MNDFPEVSVIITVYDRDKYIYSAINSVLNQTLDPSKYEILVVGKLENKEILDFLRRERIMFIENKERAIGPKIVDALKMAKGRIISFLEDDDLFHPDKLETVIENFSHDKKIGFMSHPLHIIDNENNHNTLSNTGYQSIYIDKNKPDKKERFLKAWKQGSKARYTASTVSILKDILVENIGYLQHVNFSPDSFYIFVSFKSKYNMIYSDRNLGDFRMSMHSLSKNLEELGNFIKHKKTIFILFLS